MGDAAPSRPQSSALQLSGMRTLATAWSELSLSLPPFLHAHILSRLSYYPCGGGAVVLGHFAAEPRGLTTRFLSRGQVAVSLYIVLSGFVTHLAYHSKFFTTFSSTYNFYLRRFARIWLTYYFSCILGISHWMISASVLRGKPGDAPHVYLPPFKDYVLSLLLLDAWDPTAREAPPLPTGL